MWFSAQHKKDDYCTDYVRTVCSRSLLKCLTTFYQADDVANSSNDKSKDQVVCSLLTSLKLRHTEEETQVVA